MMLPQKIPSFHIQLQYCQFMSSLKNLVSLKNLSPKNCMVKAKKRLRYVAISKQWCKYLEPICRTKRSILSGNRSGNISLQTVNSMLLALMTLQIIVMSFEQYFRQGLTNYYLLKKICFKQIRNRSKIFSVSSQGIHNSTKNIFFSCMKENMQS